MFNYTVMINRFIFQSDNTLKRLALACVLMLGLAELPAAQAQDGGKFGFVNIARVIAQSDEGQAEAKELESLGSEKQQELNARRQELEEMAAQYEKTVESGDPDAGLADRIKKLQRELERDVRQAQSDVDVSRQDRIQEIGSKVVQVIQQFATDNGYTAIFRSDNGQMVYVAPAVDITDEIIATYNEAHPVEQ